ncbi:uncharacterized protein LOC111332627 [Stylophora pistillata]|uniref:uncharacterized protein LOC111332627 n=1 Tax=Stylophora pistillata TaxID=50429 RepID=UPI000C04043A|nr:uncharacterized protein LOC111332627 [Stylophora pistillata]
MNCQILCPLTRFFTKYWVFNCARSPTRLLHSHSSYINTRNVGSHLSSGRVSLDQRCVKCNLRRFFGSLARSSQDEFSTKYVHSPSIYQILLLKRDDVRQVVTRFFSTSLMRKHGQGDKNQQGKKVNGIMFVGSPDILDHFAVITISLLLQQ